MLMRDNIPVFTEVPEREITVAPGQGYNFILEDDNLHSLRLMEKTHKGTIEIIYIDPPYNIEGKDSFLTFSPKRRNFLNIIKPLITLEISGFVIRHSK